MTQNDFFNTLLEKTLEIEKKIVRLEIELCMLRKNVEFVKKLVIIVICAVVGLNAGEFL